MRDCKKCKHLVMYDYKNRSYSCESGECEFEPEELTMAVWSYYDQNDVTQNKWHDVQTCSKCGMGGKHYDEFRYCPNCGRIMTNAKGWGNRWK